ncbi:SusC/RagA family TonB-linked outer membrane protein [Dyadobacter psychrotolerans]|uniref:SusC/RagA family TonB-linked outer membrane protein n=1 Tax=Dyadobacter psychrotolerans TaxID=2541721 RepID=A0A4R5DL68_9BACT|nr:SusC/RagA family TonB-linked outer membrane protein [Dyadobacter psychrotolerans]TDE12780.1 SusC/RagA family TonB-linked outer membrane protein [Dyadobacter psychrotolerans]
MRKNLLLSLLMVCSCWLTVYAQQKKITGKITSADGASELPGVSIIAKGTSIGTNSGSDGTYSISVPSGTTSLIYSFVGSITQEIVIGNQSVIDVKLADDTKSLQEVVVTAQGIAREKRALGYAVANIDKKLIEDRPQSDIGRTLQGKIPGVNITSTSGVSGTGTNIIIRGYSSITGSNQPLFVVDGVPFNSNTNSRGGFTSGGQSSSSRFLDLDPNGIENISVLKGLAATVLYGDQGRNGVILVTTKNGTQKNRPTEVSVSQSIFTNQVHLPDYTSTYAGGFQQAPGYFFSNWGPNFNEVPAGSQLHPFTYLTNASLKAAFPELVGAPYDFRPYTDNVEKFFRKGIISNSSLNISGGGEKVSYNASVGYNNEQGYIPGNNLKKLNIGMGINAQLNKKISLMTSFNFANTDQVSPPLNAGQGNNTLGGFPSILANVMYTPLSVDLWGMPFESPVDNRSVYFRSGNDIPNPRWMLKYYSNTGKVNRLFNSTSLRAELAKDLTLLYRVGLDTYTENQEYKYNKGGVDFVNGWYSTNDITNTIWDNSLILSYNKVVSDKLTFSGKVGGNLRNDRFRSITTTSDNQLAFGLMRHSNFISTVATNYEEEQTRMGVYGEITADFGNYLFLNVAGRNDWTSTVEKENRKIFYPSGSVSFVPTSAFPGLESEVINFLKIRAGLGTSAGFPGPYNTRNILNQVARGFVDKSGTVSSTHSVSDVLGNPNLKPELLTEYEFGIESKLLNNKIGVDLTVYRRDTRNLITATPLDPSTGYTSTTINVGKLRNEGIELGLTINPITGEGFNWEMNLNYTRNVAMVKELGGGLEEVQVAGFGGGLGNYAIPGKPFNIIKGTAIRRDANGNPIIGSNGYLLSDASPAILGNPNPAFTSALINTFRYKGISLTFMIDYRHGGAMYSTTAGALLGRGLTKDLDFDRAQSFIFPGVMQDGQPNTTQITASNVYFDNYYFFGDEGRMYDASTIRLREASISYSIPKKLLTKTPFKGISLSFSGNNIWYKALHFEKGLNFDTDNLGLGVGNGMGFEFLTGPSSRRMGGTLKLSF